MPVAEPRHQTWKPKHVPSLGPQDGGGRGFPREIPPSGNPNTVQKSRGPEGASDSSHCPGCSNSGTEPQAGVSTVLGPHPQDPKTQPSGAGPPSPLPRTI